MISATSLYLKDANGCLKHSDGEIISLHKKRCANFLVLIVVSVYHGNDNINDLSTAEAFARSRGTST